MIWTLKAMNLNIFLSTRPQIRVLYELKYHYDLLKNFNDFIKQVKTVYSRYTSCKCDVPTYSYWLCKNNFLLTLIRIPQVWIPHLLNSKQSYLDTNLFLSFFCKESKNEEYVREEQDFLMPFLLTPRILSTTSTTTIFLCFLPIPTWHPHES